MSSMTARRNTSHGGASPTIAALSLYMMTVFLTLLALALALTLPTLTTAQHANKEFVTQPILSYTFDTDPKATILPSVGQLQSAGSAFEYTYGAGTHTGVLSFDGWQDYLDFRQFYDNDGKNMSSMLLGGEMSFEVWACWTEIRSWARIFDFGAGSNGRSDNIFLSNQGSSATIAFDVQVGATSSGYLQYTGGVSLNKWRHIVVTVTATGSATANQAARHTMYVDGVSVATKLGYLPNVQQRPSAWLGRSNWESLGDARFRGLFDDVFVYNYSIGAEAVVAHYLVPRIAVLELTFHVDPRINMGSVSTGTSTFSWVASDAADTAANRAAHTGLLALNTDSTSASGPQQYLNIATYDGSSAIGTVLPPIGGDGWATADDDTMGWTFEVTMKAAAVTPNACVFDFSATGGVDRVALCFSQSGSSLIFLISNSRVGTSFALDVLTSVSANAWYHIVVDVQPQSTTAGTARFEAFVNGVFRNSKTTGVWPDRVTRSLALVGRSSVNPNVRFTGYVDSLRVYDYSLTASEMVSLGAAANGEPFAPVEPLYTTGPTVSHTFDVSIPWGQRNGGTKLGWEQVVSGRPGVMTLTSSDSQYVNLLTLPDRNYNLFPGFIGGRSISFEFWVLWNRFDSWQRLIDLSASSSTQQNNAFMDNIFVATLAQSDSSQAATMVFAVVAGPQGYSDARVTHSGEVRLNRWYHVVLTVKVDRTIDPVLSTAAQLQLYVDGNLDQATNTAVPRFVSRPNSWLGRSRYSADAYLTASIDAFHYYDYALELEQVRAHYLVPRPPLFELTFSSVPSSMPLMNASDSYGWASIDETSGIAGQTNHPGVLTLDASRMQHIDLTVASGRTTVGAVMPQLAVLPDLTLFTTTYEFAPGTARQRLGMTFEMSFKYGEKTGAMAKLFACGASQSADVVSLGWAAGSRDLVFSVQNTDVDRSYNTVVVKNAHYEKWYHVLIALRLTNTRTFTSTWSTYVNGELVSSDVNGVFPYVTVRRQCAIGRDLSATAAGYVHGMVDLIRVYDYALSATESTSMYAALATVEDTYDGITPAVEGGADAASSSSGLSGGAVAGIVIASLAGLAALFVLLVCFRARQAKAAHGGTNKFGAANHAHVELSEVREHESEEATSDQA